MFLFSFRTRCLLAIHSIIVHLLRFWGWEYLALPWGEDSRPFLWSYRLFRRLPFPILWLLKNLLLFFLSFWWTVLWREARFLIIDSEWLARDVLLFVFLGPCLGFLILWFVCRGDRLYGAHFTFWFCDVLADGVRFFYLFGGFAMRTLCGFFFCFFASANSTHWSMIVDR